MSSLENVTDQNFGQVVGQDGLTLVDFWAPWCGPCRMLGPTLEQVQSEMPDKVKIVKFNIDENPEYAAKFKVMNIPLMILFKDGDKVDQLMGNVPKSQVVSLINRNL